MDYSKFFIFNKALLLINFLYADLLIPQISWEWQNPLPQGNTLHVIARVPDSERVIAIGQAGTILVSNQDYTNWDFTQRDINLYSIVFPSDKIGFIFCNEGMILNSSDQGATWTMNYFNSNITIRSSFFVNDSIGFAVGKVYDGNDSHGIILKTTDSGMTWTQTEIGNLVSSVFFVNSDIGFVGGYGYVYKTTDSGRQWTHVTIGSRYFIVSMYFTSSEIGFAVVHEIGVDCRCSHLLRTQDGGQTWHRLNDFSISIYLRSIKFKDPMHGIIVGDDGFILLTSDGGDSWRVLQQSTNTLYDCCYLNNHTIMSVGEGGKIILSQDGGTSWHSVSRGTSERLSDVFFVDPEIGFAVGDNGTILKTVNAGENWTACVSGVSRDLDSIFFVNQTMGFAAGAYQTILNTTDGGFAWSVVHSGSNRTLQVLHFINDQTGFATGSGILLKTTDGGLNWHQVGDNNPAVTDMIFLNSDVGIGVGRNGRIYKTIDGGANWMLKDSGVGVNLASVDFNNEHIGFVSGGGGVVLKTTDGGDSWIHLYTHIDIDDYLSSVCFHDENTGYAAGKHAIHYTTDGGDTWASGQKMTDNYLFSIDAIDEKTSYVVGQMGAIIKICRNTTSVTARHVNESEDIQTLQTYPNPFNNSTTIQFRLIHSCHVKLDIYDIRGASLINLVDSHTHQGHHTIRWNGTDDNNRHVSSGLYLCRLKFENQVITRRILCIR